MEDPKTYLDRKNRMNQRYLFISYAHDDVNLVYPVLKELYDKGINFWYDVRLKVGDTWDESVAEQLQLLNCKGIVFFLSETSVKSNAVYEEMKMVKTIRETIPSFVIIPVFIGIKDYASLMDIYVKEKQFERMAVLNDILDYGKKLYIPLDDKVVGNIFETASSAYVTEENFIELGNDNFLQLQNIEETAKGLFLRLGQYYLDDKEEKKDIRWKLFCKVDYLYYLVSEYCLDFEPYNSAHKLESIIYRDLKRYNYVQSVSLINEKDIEKYSKKIGPTLPTNFAESIRAQQLKVFWVADEEDRDKLYLYNSNNKKINIDYNFKALTINAGIRLVLCINSKKIAEE